MLFGQGNGYSAIVLETTAGTRVGPGAVLVHEGDWMVGGVRLNAGQGVELLAPEYIVGSGLAAAVTYDDDQGVDLSEWKDRETVIPRDVVRHDKPWGWEREVLTRAKRIQLKLICVYDGHRTSEQYHVHKDEVMLHIDGCNLVAPVAPRQLHRVAGPHLYFEASTYHPDDVVRTADDYGRKS